MLPILEGDFINHAQPVKEVRNALPLSKGINELVLITEGDAFLFGAKSDGRKHQYRNLIFAKNANGITF